MRRIAVRTARKYGLDPRIFETQINVESGFNDKAVSPAGARGAGQLMPGTARSLGVRNVNDPAENLDGAARYLVDQLHHFHGDYRKALAAYNAGPGNIGAGLGYADKILGGKDTKAHGLQGGTATKTIPGVNRSADRKKLALQFLLGDMPAASPTDAVGSLFEHDPIIQLGLQMRQLKDKPAKTVTVNGGSGGGEHGTANFEGHTVAAWIKPELVKARRAGWKGSVESGFRSLADQTRIYNSGVRPAAKPGTSNHEGADFPRGAVDVSDAAQLARILQRLGSPLKWAGSKDPVHFSHPHNGSY